MTQIYKLLNRDRTSYGGYPWIIGAWSITSGEGDLCGPGWLHAYTHPMLAVLLNPIHANIADPVLYLAEGGGQVRDDHGLKVGYTRMRIMMALPLPALTTEHRVRFALACAALTYEGPRWLAWAHDWLVGRDRSAASASSASVSAAWDTVSAADLITCAEWAISDALVLPSRMEER